jgi:cation transport regulator ChaB
MNDPIKIELPFAGFYESWHDDAIDRAIESAFEDDQGNMPDDMWDVIMSADVDWSAIRKEYCREYVSCFAQEFDLTLEYDGMQSPREYNFTTDRVFATVGRAEFNSKVRKVVEALPEWPTEIRERFTSRSGFWSHYSNDHTDPEWTAKDLDECQYGVMLEVYINHLHTSDPNNNHEWSEREYHMLEDIEVYSFSSVNDAIEAIEKEKAKPAEARP